MLIVVIGAAANLLGWDIRGWFSDLWDTLNDISIEYIIAGVALKTVQTILTAFGWYSILKFAYPGEVRWLDILACYAASVALNGILPANLGTLVMLLMFTTIIASATFAAILGAYAVQKIFYTLIGFFVYLYLFLSVGGSFDIKFAFVHEHPWATITVFVGGAFLLFLLARRIWPKILSWWDQAKDGGGILAQPRTYLARVFLPVVPQLGCKPRCDGRVPEGVRHPGQLPHADADLRWQLDRQRNLGDTRRSRRDAGIQRRLAQRDRDADASHRVFRRTATGHDVVEHHPRDHPGRLGVRLDGRSATRVVVVRRRKGQGRRAKGGSRGAEGSEALGEGSARACLDRPELSEWDGSTPSSR